MSQAERGARSFGPNADTYHLARPGYPDAAVDWASEPGSWPKLAPWPARMPWPGG